MALFASTCAFSWSKWNASCGSEHLVVQVGRVPQTQQLVVFRFLTCGGSSQTLLLLLWQRNGVRKEIYICDISLLGKEKKKPTKNIPPSDRRASTMALPLYPNSHGACTSSAHRGARSWNSLRSARPSLQTTLLGASSTPPSSTFSGTP